VSRVIAWLVVSALGVLWYMCIPLPAKEHRIVVGIALIWIIGPLIWVATVFT
jgi:hypothetical protein